MKQVSNGMKIKDMKIMRSKDRRDTTGTFRSLGYGFIEVDTHDNALKLLRATNNNPNIFGENRRPFVEFSVENAKAVKTLEQRRQKSGEKMMQKAEFEDSDATALVSGKTERQKQRDQHKKRIERYKRKRERQKEAKVIQVAEKSEYKVPEEDHDETLIQGSKNLKRKSEEINESGRKRTRKIRNENKTKDEEKFNSLVTQYKEKLFGTVETNKKMKSDHGKWFE